MTKQRTSERHMVFCMLLVDVISAVIALFVTNSDTKIINFHIILQTK